MHLKLLVLRTADIRRLADFYSQFGLVFEYHQHGNSPFHYAAKMGPTVLEIYPLTKNQSSPDKNLRLGFSIDHFDETIQALKQTATVFTLEPTQTEFGCMAIITDPDGRKIELYKH